MRPSVFAVAAVLLLAAILPLALCGSSGGASGSPGVLISEVSPEEEGVSLLNAGGSDVDLEGFSLTDGEGTVTFSESYVLGAGDVLHVVKKRGAGWFTSRDPLVEIGGGCVSKKGSFVLSNSGDEVSLFDGSALLDCVCYGSSSGVDGWTGDPAKCQSGCYLQRIGDGRDASAWQALEPGWTGLTYGDAFVCEVEPFSFPESGGEPVYRALSSAEETVDISIYILSCPNLVALLCQLEDRGVEVRVLLEGSPLGTDVTTEMELMRSLCDRGGEVRLINPPGADGGRYTYAHAKYAVVDGETTVVTSENWTSGNMGYGLGNRGWGAVASCSGLAEYMEAVFENDFSAEWGDVVPLSTAYPSQRAYGYSLEYEEPDAANGTVYSCVVRPVLSPDDSLDALQRFMSSAEERLYAEEMDLGSGLSLATGDTPVAWMAEAASRGVDARLILDSTSDDATETATRVSAAAGIKAVARAGGSDYSMIHNKGVVSDDSVWVGSVNWTSTSFGKNREAALVIESAGAADYFAELFIDDFGVDVSDVEETGVAMTAEVVGSGGGYKVVLRADAPAGYELEWDPGDGSTRSTTASVCVFDAVPGDHVATVKVVGTEAVGEAAYSVPEADGGGTRLIYVAAAAVVLAGLLASVLKRRTGGRRPLYASDPRRRRRGVLPRRLPFIGREPSHRRARGGPMEIRQMRPSEADSAYAVMCMTLDQYYDRSILDFFLLQWPRGQIVAADPAGTIVGYLAGSRLQSGAASVALLCVAPGMQGRGIGTALLARFMDQARMEGVRTVQLEVRKENRRALRFYERMGFMAVENLPGFYGDGGAGVRMVASTARGGCTRFQHRSNIEWA